MVMIGLNSGICRGYCAPMTTPAFDPSSISGLVGWLDVSDAGTVTLDTGGTTTVSAIANKGSWVGSFSQANKSQQPAYIANAYNGKACMRFDGSNDFLSASYASFFAAAFAGKDHTAFVVGARNSAGNNGFYGTFDGSSYPTGGNGAAMGYWGDTTLAQDNQGAWHDWIQATVSGYSTRQLRQYEHWLNVTGGGGAGRRELYRDKALVASRDGNAYQPTVAGAPVGLTQFRVGCHESFRMLNGDICAILIYGRALSGSERTYVRDGLTSLYGV